MNFTREPIIETVITPREGCKLVVRSSKGVNQEDYFVDAVEVVSFGHSFFFRSQERPKSFLVPVSDYEILELKETRMVLKNASTERSIKIGGGREAPPRPREEEEPAAPSGESRPSGAPSEPRERGKRDRRRRGRRGRDRQDMRPSAPREGEEAPPMAEAAPVSSPEEKAPSFISKLFPPPQTLIKESLSRYKPAEEEGRGSFEEPPLDSRSEEDDNEE